MILQDAAQNLKKKRYTKDSKWGGVDDIEHCLAPLGRFDWRRKNL